MRLTLSFTYGTIPTMMANKGSNPNPYIAIEHNKYNNHSFNISGGSCPPIIVTDELDDSITSDMMYELECDVMGENRKCIPYIVKYLLMLLMLLGIVGNLFYVTIIGGQLPPLMLKEWLLYLLCSIAITVQFQQ
jgi:hypothetical protein